MIFNNPYWSTQTKLDLLARWLIIHSIIYYEIGDSIVSDEKWNDNAKQYIMITWENPHIDVSKTRWHYVMFDFDGNTGFHLYSKLKRDDKKKLMHTARYLVYEYGDKGLITDPRRSKTKSRGGKKNGKEDSNAE